MAFLHWKRSQSKLASGQGKTIPVASETPQVIATACMSLRRGSGKGNTDMPQ
jgi:hypothetical protein